MVCGSALPDDDGPLLLREVLLEGDELGEGRAEGEAVGGAGRGHHGPQVGAPAGVQLLVERVRHGVHAHSY